MENQERIILVRLTRVDNGIMETLKQRLERTFDRPVEIRASTGSLDYAYRPSRNQYESPRILKRLRRIKRNPDDKILGVVDVDLYSPGFDYVYGEAEIATGVGTLSLYRLRPEDFDPRTGDKIFSERVVKEAIHELGHLYGLGHCRKRTCVMRFCPDISDVDIKTPEFCLSCGEKLEQNSY